MTDEDPSRPRPSARTCTRQMLRIRRFEAKCVELYQAQKIRGFLHLYDGEEAVAVGVMAGARAARRGGRHLPRAWPGAGARRADGAAHGRDARQARRLLPRPRRLDAPLRPRAPLLRRQRHRRRRAAAGASASPWPTSSCGRARSPPASSARARSARARSTRRMNLAALWQLPVLFVCENNLYAMGVPLADARVETDIWRKAAGLPHGRPSRSTAWTRCRSRPRRGARSSTSAPARGPTSWNAAPTASARIRCSTPRPTARATRSRAGSSATRSSGCAPGWPTTTCSATDEAAAIEAGVASRDRRRGRLRRGRHAGAGRRPRALRADGRGGAGACAMNAPDPHDLPRSLQAGDPRRAAGRSARPS